MLSLATQNLFSPFFCWLFLVILSRYTDTRTEYSALKQEGCVFKKAYVVYFDSPFKCLSCSISWHKFLLNISCVPSPNSGGHLLIIFSAATYCFIWEIQYKTRNRLNLEFSLKSFVFCFLPLILALYLSQAYPPF